MENDPLSAEEIQQLRQIIEAERRMKWLHTMLRRWTTYIAGVILATFAIWKAVTEYVQIKIGIR